MAKKFWFSKIAKGPFYHNLSTIYQQIQPERVKWGQHGGLGAFFSKFYIYLYYNTFVYTYKNNPPFPQKSPETLKTLTFLWGIFSKMPHKKPPKSPLWGAKIPHRAKKHPARLAEPYGVGLVFISTNILLRGLHLRFQLKELGIWSALFCPGALIKRPLYRSAFRLLYYQEWPLNCSRSLFSRLCGTKYLL